MIFLLFYRYYIFIIYYPIYFIIDMSGGVDKLIFRYVFI